MRLAICLSHPIQYKTPVLRRLAEADGLELQVFYYSNRGLETKQNQYHKVIYAWDIPLLDGYASEIVPNRVNEEKWKIPYIQPFFNPGIRHRLQAGSYDAVMVHSYLYPSDWLAYWTARRNEIPVLFYGEMYPRDNQSGWPRLARLLLHKPMLRGADACLAIGSVARQVFSEAYQIPGERIFLAPYSVDNKYFISQVERQRLLKQQIKADLGIPSETPVVLCVAAMVAKKRQQDLIDAIARVHMPARLALVGDGPLMESIKDACQKFLPETILTGFVNQSELPRYYAIADLFVLPSSWEEFGLVVNEAMCAGLPILASNGVAAARDLVIEGENGYTFEPGDTQRMAVLIEQLLRNPEMRRSFGRRSLEIISGWGPEQTVDGILAALDYIAQRRSGNLKGVR